MGCFSAPPRGIRCQIIYVTYTVSLLQPSFLMSIAHSFPNLAEMTTLSGTFQDNAHTCPKCWQIIPKKLRGWSQSGLTWENMHLYTD